ncbi:uncharacterized protein TNCV_2304771 [Trichonephila clavipes]|nr:uncharacterized protein TNCV_2304771 [Trichonephila clavipes]
MKKKSPVLSVSRFTYCDILALLSCHCHFRCFRSVAEKFVVVVPCASEAQTATRGLLATDHDILNHGQVTWTTPELAPPLLTATSHQREDVSALDRFNVHRFPTRRIFGGTGLELVIRPSYDPIPIPLGYHGRYISGTKT